jgi:cytidylate kinase
VGSFADKLVVRRDLVARQQQLGRQGGVVAEGRDIGSVVFPDAELKIRMVAELDERARRRYGELTAKGLSATYEEVRADIEARDREDAERDYGATNPGVERVEIDTTGMTLEEQVAAVVALARQRGA